MRLFLTGVTGLLGAAVAAEAAARKHEVVGVRHRSAEAVPGAERIIGLDLADVVAARGAVEAVAPDAVVNCAAISAMADCEREPELAWRVNVGLPEALARVAAARGVPFIHISSEQVFDGRSERAYRREDPVSPLNRYGEQKAESERVVQEAAAGRAVVLRIPLLLGNSLNGGRGLHERLFADWAAGRVPGMFVDEFRQPCRTANLAKVILDLCERADINGLYHWAGAELRSRHDIAVQIRNHFGLTEDAAPVRAQQRDAVYTLARSRPQWLRLETGPLSERLGRRPETLEEALASLRVPPGCGPWYRGVVRAGTDASAR